MNIRWIGCLCGVLSMMGKAQEYPRELTFSASEQQIWQLTMQRPVGAGQPILARLQALTMPTAATQALLGAQQCRFALQSSDKPALAAARLALKRLESAGGAGEFAGSAAGYKCQQLSKFVQGESTETRQLSFLAYHSLTERDAPALHAWVALDYGHDALAAGFFDSAASAAGQVLSIARRNQISQLEADSLALQAEVFSAQGQYPEALRSIERALVLQTDPQQQRPLQLLQADLFKAAGHTPQAQALYQTLWQQQSLPAGLALQALYLQQQQTAAAAALSAALQQAALQSGDRELIAISRLRHAMVLLGQGQIAAAQAAFTDASGWLAQHRLALYLPELHHWAELLASQGQHQAAFTAMQQSLRLQRQLDADNYSTQAQLSSTLLIAEQRSRELKLVDLQQQLAASRRAADRSAGELWPLRLLCAALAALLLVLVWRLVRR